MLRVVTMLTILSVSLNAICHRGGVAWVPPPGSEELSRGHVALGRGGIRVEYGIYGSDHADYQKMLDDTRAILIQRGWQVAVSAIGGDQTMFASAGKSSCLYYHNYFAGADPYVDDAKYFIARKDATAANLEAVMHRGVLLVMISPCP